MYEPRRFAYWTFVFQNCMAYIYTTIVSSSCFAFEQDLMFETINFVLFSFFKDNHAYFCLILMRGLGLVRETMRWFRKHEHFLYRSLGLNCCF